MIPMSHFSRTPLLALALAVLPATIGAQSSERRNEREVERSIERMAEQIAAAAERIATRAGKQATLMADRIEREFDRKRKSDPSWRWEDDDVDVQQLRTRIDTTVAFSPEGTIDLSNLSGDIIVTGWSRREVQIKATSERANLELDISSSRISLEAEGRGSMWGSRSRGETRYEVSIPRGARVIARSTSGDVTVSGTGGEVDAGSTSGDVQVEDAARRIELSSVSGDVTGRALKGTIEATSVSGSVEVENAEGDLHAGTTSGDVVLTNVTSRDIEASTTSGEITFAGDLAADGRYEFHSHSGTIELTIPAAANAKFSVETFSGELDSAFPITLQPGDRSSRRPRRFEFTVGNGGARVIAESFSGDLEIRKR
jgi:DUF4097 and DUF4098 domain-containing protein YvlB